MKYLFLFTLPFFSAHLLAQGTSKEYPVNFASLVQPGVRKGKILKLTFDQSKIFPGTWREYWVYVPAQYDPQGTACVYVNQDGIHWNAPTVFDNLILPTPGVGPEHIILGGSDFNDLYVASNGKIFRRKLRVWGANSFEAAVKPSKPKL